MCGVFSKESAALLTLLPAIALSAAVLTGAAGCGEEDAADKGTDAAVIVVEPAGDYNPQINPGDFIDGVTNKYFSLAPGTTQVYEMTNDEGTERIEFQVTGETREVMGVKATVVWDRVWMDGELIEDTRDWYAQDKEGNVWYFGEDSKEIEDGKVVSTKGSWEAGVDGARPGMIMMADPVVGETYRQEYYQGEAEDLAEILSLEESVEVPYGSYDNCLKTREWSPLEPDVTENKYYCMAIGNVVLEVDPDSGDRVELIEVKKV